MGRGGLHELDPGGITAPGMLDHAWRKRAEIARRCLERPAHNGVRVGLELFEQDAEQAGPCHAAVMCPQHPPQRFAAEPGPAALIRDRQPPAANAVMTSLELGPADRAGADDDHAAIMAAMRADAGGLCICGDYRAAEWVLLCPRRSQIGGFAGARERQTGSDPRQIA